MKLERETSLKAKNIGQCIDTKLWSNVFAELEKSRHDIPFRYKSGLWSYMYEECKELYHLPTVNWYTWTDKLYV